VRLSPSASARAPLELAMHGANKSGFLLGPPRRPFVSAAWSPDLCSVCRFAEVGELKGGARRTHEDLIVVWDQEKNAYRSLLTSSNPRAVERPLPCSNGPALATSPRLLPATSLPRASDSTAGEGEAGTRAGRAPVSLTSPIGAVLGA
jgi:hypothetical protein